MNESGHTDEQCKNDGLFFGFDRQAADYILHSSQAKLQCSYSLPSSIADGFGSQFATVQVTLVEKEIELDFTSFLNQEEDLHIKSTGTDNGNWERSGGKKAPVPSGSSSSKLKEVFLDVFRDR